MSMLSGQGSLDCDLKLLIVAGLSSQFLNQSSVRKREKICPRAGRAKLLTCISEKICQQDFYLLFQSCHSSDYSVDPWACCDVMQLPEDFEPLLLVYACINCGLSVYYFA